MKEGMKWKMCRKNTESQERESLCSSLPTQSQSWICLKLAIYLEPGPHRAVQDLGLAIGQDVQQLCPCLWDTCEPLLFLRSSSCHMAGLQLQMKYRPEESNGRSLSPQSLRHHKWSYCRLPWPWGCSLHNCPYTEKSSSLWMHLSLPLRLAPVFWPAGYCFFVLP